MKINMSDSLQFALHYFSGHYITVFTKHHEWRNTSHNKQILYIFKMNSQETIFTHTMKHLLNHIYITTYNMSNDVPIIHDSKNLKDSLNPYEIKFDTSKIDVCEATLLTGNLFHLFLWLQVSANRSFLVTPRHSLVLQIPPCFLTTRAAMLDSNLP